MMQFGNIKVETTSVSMGCAVIICIMLFVSLIMLYPTHYMFNFWLKYNGKSSEVGYGISYLLAFATSAFTWPVRLVFIGAFVTFIYSYFI